MQQFSLVKVILVLFALACLCFLPACGGGSSNKVVVAKLVLSPTTLSMNEGDVLSLSATPENSSGATVVADVTFTSSNPSLVTVSTGGLLCAGTWDANFIVCTPSSGQAGVGQATITATTNPGNVTATATVYTHLKVDRVVVNPSPTCTSMGAAAVASASAFNTSAPGCTPSAPCDITSTVGPFTYGTNNSAVVALNTSGVLTAETPGTTTIFASVAGVNSVSAPYVTCPVNVINLHLSNSTLTNLVFSGTGGTLSVTADSFDSNGTGIGPPIIFGTSEKGVVTVTAGSAANIATLTAVAPGTATITATCSYPSCNIGLPAQYGTNVIIATVPGTTSTNVYAASTLSTMLVPIATASNTVGTAITLPYAPNSIMADPAGAAIYLGSATALMAVNPTSGAVTTYGLAGNVVAISPDGSFLLISDPVANTVTSFNVAHAVIESTAAGVTTTSSAYTADSGWNEYVTGMSLVYGLPILAQTTFPLTYTPNALDIIAQGGLTYITSAGSHEIDVRSTCNNMDVQTLTANAPTLIKAIPNGSGAVATDPPNLDVVTTPNPLNGGCPTVTQSSIATYNLNTEAFTPQQVFMSPDSSHAWIVSNLPELLSFNLTNSTPSTIGYTGGVVAYNGGITLDGTRIYLGTSDNTVHVLQTSTGTDVGGVAVNLKDANGAVVAPNLVAVQP